jgi:hypothetical protein
VELEQRVPQAIKVILAQQDLLDNRDLKVLLVVWVQLAVKASKVLKGLKET